MEPISPFPFPPSAVGPSRKSPPFGCHMKKKNTSTPYAFNSSKKKEGEKKTRKLQRQMKLVTIIKYKSKSGISHLAKASPIPQLRPSHGHSPQTPKLSYISLQMLTSST